MKKIFPLFFLISFCNILNAQWSWLNPLPSGFDNLQVQFSNNQTGFILNKNGDLIRTSNIGNTWQVINNFPQAYKLDLKDSTIIVLSGYAELNISYDLGNTWQNSNTSLVSKFNDITIINKTTFIAFEYNSLYYNSFYKSVDSGKTWTLIKTINFPVDSYSFISEQVGFYTIGGNIYKTIDGGKNWNLMFTPTLGYNVFKVQCLDEYTIFAYSYNYYTYSLDGGLNWVTKNYPSDIYNNVYTAFFVNPTIGYIGGQNGFVYRTLDGGNTWGSIVPANGIDIKEVNFTSNDTGFIVRQNGIIQKTTNAGLWWQDYGFSYKDFNNISFGDTAVGYVTSQNNVYKTYNKGKTWQQLGFTVGTTPVFNASKYFSGVHFINADTGIVISSDYLLLHRTFDGGKTWDTTFFPKIPYNSWVYKPSMKFITPLIGYLSIDNGGYPSYNGVLKTLDGGLNWNLEYVAPVDMFQNLKIFYVNQAIGYGIDNGLLYKTSDSSKTWKQIFNFGTISTYDIAFIDTNKGFVVGDGYLFSQTNDGGNTWQNVTNIPYSTYENNWIKFYDNKIGYMYNVDGNLFKTFDGGDTWHLDTQSASSTWYSIDFTKDTIAYVVGKMGNILSSPIKGALIDPIIIDSNYACVISLSIALSAAFSRIDSISFELTNNVTGKISLFPLTPAFVQNGSITCSQSFSNLANNNYHVRLKYFYNNKYEYGDTLNFTPFSFPQPNISIDTNNVLSSNWPNNNYQWYINGNPIQGANTEKYQATASGNYSVKIKEGSCEGIMSNIITVNLNNLGVQLFPNPAHNFLYLNNTQNRTFKYTITDITGRQFSSGLFSVPHFTINNGLIKNGVYFLNLTDAKTNKKATITFVKM